MTRVDHRALHGFVVDVLGAVGLRPGSAGTVADLAVLADLQGLTTHGVARLPSYLARIEAGAMAADPDPRILADLPSATHVDAENGWGQVATTLAMDATIEKASRTGIAVASIARSNHFGVAGHYVARAARAGLVGMATTNASPAMAPFNASTALLGTNPIAFGIPAEQRPIVLDMSSSMVARGRIRKAFREGASIPEGWANGPDGRATTDPELALAGLLAPIGGAKGTGLSLVIDLLTGVLSGTATTGSVTNITDASRPSRTGHLVVAIDPDAFIGRARLAADVEAVVERIHAMPAIDGGRVLLPGERELLAEERARVEGVEVSDVVAADLARLGARHGRPSPIAI